jgi:hypothetical protein
MYMYHVRWVVVGRRIRCSLLVGMSGCGWAQSEMGEMGVGVEPGAWGQRGRGRKRAGGGGRWGICCARVCLRYIPHIMPIGNGIAKYYSA